VWLDSTGSATSGDPQHHGALRRWVELGKPLIVRRPGVSQDGRSLSVGLALPPAAPKGEKLRMAFEVPVSAIQRLSLPPLWSGCRTAADDATAAEVHAAAGRGGEALRMFGSHAWQSLTGLPYVSAGSDLDLLIGLSSPASWRAVREALSSIPLPAGVDLEIVIAGDASFSWREYSCSASSLLFKGNSDVWKGKKSDVEALLDGPANRNPSPASIAIEASRALRDELAAYPKPGLVSHVDSGSHPDMDAGTFLASIGAIEPFFADLARAGADGAGLPHLQQIGLAAERAMERATGGRNTHRGAIFSIGLLAAAAGLWARAGTSATLGTIMRDSWADGILLPDDLPGGSDGIDMGHLHGVGGARREAKDGFPSVYHIGLPALRKAGLAHPGACVQVFFELLAQCEDTTLIKRGGREGWQFGRSAARRFLAAGGVLVPGWQGAAEDIHRAFVARNLTAGGVADLLAATLFVHRIEEGG